MKGALVVATETAVVIIDAMALLIIVIGTIEVFIGGAKVFPSADGHERRAIWLRYARWLVGGLSFQLAADIIETSITTGWEAIGRLAAVALIRTFLNYFLERDLAEYRQLQGDVAPDAQEDAFHRKGEPAVLVRTPKS
jgi:uncharacterized membrane protein